MDNLSSHNRKAFVDRFGEKIGSSIAGVGHILQVILGGIPNLAGQGDNKSWQPLRDRRFSDFLGRSVGKVFS